jgi:hypothetical protein
MVLFGGTDVSDPDAELNSRSGSGEAESANPDPDPGKKIERLFNPKCLSINQRRVLAPLVTISLNRAFSRAFLQIFKQYI